MGSATEEMKQQNFVVACGWSENADLTFLSDQKHLIIFVKDGYSLFKANAELLTNRLANISKKTTIIIAHPDSPYMDAIANMDDNKKGKPESQRSDSLQAVRLLQEIQQKLASDDQGDISLLNRVTFMGHHNVPTWTGFVGDDIARVNLYPTRPYRGSLLCLTGQKNGKQDSGMVYKGALTDCDEILAEAKKDPRNNLWNYQLPSTMPDLRQG